MIISDQGTYFHGQFDRVCVKHGVTHHVAMAYHPQMSGQVEVTIMELTQILEKVISHN